MLAWLLSNGILALALTCFLLGLSRFVRLSPATWHALWVIVLFKLISPVGLGWEVPISFGENEVPAKVAEVVPLHEVVLFPTKEVEYLESYVWVTEAERASGNDAPLFPSASFTMPVAMESETSSPLLFMGLILLVGAILFLIRQVLATWQFARIARHAGVAPEALSQQVTRLSHHLGVRVPVVKVLKGLCSPLVWALRKPVLLWPEGLEKTLDRDGSDTVLIHELAHLRRRDHWVRWLEVLCGIVHWWNPLFWFVRRQIRLQSELACDAWVMATKPDHRRAYAEALLQVCSRSMRVSRAAPALGVGGDGKRDFQRRLTMIMQNETPCRLSRRSKFAVLALVLAILPGWSLAQEKPKEEKKPNEKSSIIFDFDFTIGIEAEKAKKAQELEAKIAQLMKELAALKGEKSSKWLIEKKVEVPKTAETKVVEREFRVVQLAEKIPSTPEVKVFDQNGNELKDIEVTLTQVNPNSPPRIVLTRKGQPLTDSGVKVFVAQNPPPHSAIRVTEVPEKLSEPKKVEATTKNPPEVEVRLRETQDMMVVDYIKRQKAFLSAMEEAREGKPIALSRATYKLPAEKAESLGKFLKENVKVPVFEMKYEKDSLTVTTTPEVQTMIGNLVAVMLGKKLEPPMAVPLHSYGPTPLAIPLQIVPPPPVKASPRLKASPDTTPPVGK